AFERERFVSVRNNSESPQSGPMISGGCMRSLLNIFEPLQSERSRTVRALEKRKAVRAAVDELDGERGFEAMRTAQTLLAHAAVDDSRGFVVNAHRLGLHRRLFSLELRRCSECEGDGTLIGFGRDVNAAVGVVEENQPATVRAVIKLIRRAK